MRGSIQRQLDLLLWHADNCKVEEDGVTVDDSIQKDHEGEEKESSVMKEGFIGRRGVRGTTSGREEGAETFWKCGW